MIETEDLLEKLSFLILLSLCRSSMSHLPFRLFVNGYSEYENVVVARHQPSHEAILHELMPICNYKNTE